MKTLVVYYSRTGTTKKVGEEIANQLKADSEEIIDLKNRNGPFGFFISVKDAVQRKLAKIKPIENNPTKYGRVIIGTPVWGSNMAPAIRTYLTDNKLDGKKINFFCTASGSGMMGAIARMEEFAPKAKIGGNLAVLAKDVKSGKYKEKVKEFIELLNEDNEKA